MYFSLAWSLGTVVSCFNCLSVGFLATWDFVITSPHRGFSSLVSIGNHEIMMLNKLPLQRRVNRSVEQHWRAAPPKIWLVGSIPAKLTALSACYKMVITCQLTHRTVTKLQEGKKVFFISSGQCRSSKKCELFCVSYLWIICANLNFLIPLEVSPSVTRIWWWPSSTDFIFSMTHRFQ